MAYLALDLGAGSGRAIVGEIKNGKLVLDEVHRFTNKQVRLGDTLYWDFLALFAEIKQGIALAVKKGYTLSGISVDTWGVDFGLLDENGHLLSNPVCYRDARTQGTLEQAYTLLSKEDIYKTTGIQLMEINSAFQLLALKTQNCPQFKIADKLLFMPDLVNYFLTNVACNEYTIASTSQLLNAETKEWEPEIFDKLGLPISIMQKIVYPGDVIGKLTTSIENETSAKNVDVIASGSHDTANAIGAIPAKGTNWAFLSSGTWSLMGVEVDKPILTPDALAADFTNEGGIDNKILFMRNITGLWLLQCLMAEWEREDGKPVEYNEILAAATNTPVFKSIVNSDNPEFTNPVSMQAAIINYCKQTNQAIPITKGEFVRCVIDSLALKYYFVLEKLQQIINKQIDCLYIVGGGSRNELLNQATANALNIPIITGPVEGTAMGNIIQQAIAKKEVENIEEGRKIIGNSLDMKTYSPKDNVAWLPIIEKFRQIFN